jgi:hypothetical protein
MEKKKQTQKTKLADILLKYNVGNSSPEEDEASLEINTAEIDRRLVELSELIGRELSEEEEEDLLTIVDGLTPTKYDGTYMVDLVPFDYAWTIYEAKKEIELEKFIGNLEIDK